MKFIIQLLYDYTIIYDYNQWLNAKLEVGERCIQVWAPDNGRVPFPSI